MEDATLAIKRYSQVNTKKGCTIPNHPSLQPFARTSANDFN